MTEDDRTNERPILVAVDFSPHSEAALVWAADAARKFGVALVVLHVVHDPAEAPGYYPRAMRESAGSGSSELHRIEDMARQAMDGFLEDVASRQPELGPLESRLVVGLPATRILEVASEVGARLIVMGSQGRTGLAHLMLGSKAEQVVRLSRIPVTIVKE